MKGYMMRIGKSGVGMGVEGVLWEGEEGGEE